MANASEILSALSGMGFGSSGPYWFGSWRGYAVTLRRINNRNFFADVAIRFGGAPAELRKTLAAAVSGNKMKVNGNQAVTGTKATCSFAIGGKDDAQTRLAECLDAMTAALWNAGVGPADTCAISGTPNPDSLCLVPQGNLFSYQPVSAAAIRQLSAETREKVEENQTNGSVTQGVIGAVLGMLVGLIPNVLIAVFAERIAAVLFALVPLCAMFGYKLFKGKMGKISIVIVILVSLIAVPLIPYFELVIYFVKDAHLPLGQAFLIAKTYMTHPDFLNEIGGELVKLLLFMGLGILIAWSYMSKQTNSGALRNLEAQMATLRPNPAARTQDDVYSQA